MYFLELTNHSRSQKYSERLLDSNGLSYICRGQQLLPGSTLRSTGSNPVLLSYQTDGNLVIYRVFPPLAKTNNLIFKRNFLSLLFNSNLLGLLFDKSYWNVMHTVNYYCLNLSIYFESRVSNLDGFLQLLENIFGVNFFV